MKNSVVKPNREQNSMVPTQRRRLLWAANWAWQRPWLALPVLALPALWPFFESGLPQSADGALHLLRVVALDQHVRQGVLHPRWSPELYTGLGYPVFNFYGPFAYYLAEMLHLLGLDVVSALMGAFALLVLGSGVGMYLLARDVLGTEQRWGALVAATAYMYAPYLLTNVFIRGAIAEVGAQAWLPWVFWSARRLLTAPRAAQYVLPMALSLGGLAITHNITLLLTPLALVGYMVVIWWQAGRSGVRLGWATAGIAAAMGVSAFFWMPMIGERQLLAESAYETAAVFMTENVWRWGNFLDTTFVFEHTFAIPFQLGLVQAALAVVGLLVIRRWDAEWLYFIVLAVLAGLGIGAWSLPLWLSSETLLIVQFSWRLLALLSIPLALFTGAILVRLGSGWMGFAGACVLLGLIIVANRPQVGWMPVLARAGERITPPVISQYEYRTGAMGTTATQEFRPRWNDGNAYDSFFDSFIVSRFFSIDDKEILIKQANAQRLKLAVSSSQGGLMRFTSLYYPAWQVTLADGRALPTYPSTNLGLLTVDVPRGSHELDLHWAGTGLQRWASALSLLTLAALVLFTWRVNRPRWLVAIPLGLLIVGLTAVLVRPPLVEVQSPAQSVASASIQMLGYRLEQAGPDLTIYPYWYTRHTPPADMVVRWQVRNETGQVVSEAAARPYFNSQEASNWPPGTLVDDAYQLALPAGLAAGRYDLLAQVVEGVEVTSWALVGDVVVASPIPVQPEMTDSVLARYGKSEHEAPTVGVAADSQSIPGLPTEAHLERYRSSIPGVRYPADARFANGMRLIAYDLQPDLVDPDSNARRVRLSLFWRGDAPNPAASAGDQDVKWWNVSEFDVYAHLTDGNAVWQTANRRFADKQIMARGGIVESVHEFVIPQEMPIGKTYFETGLYYYSGAGSSDIVSERISIVDREGRATGNAVTLGGVMVGEPSLHDDEPTLPIRASWEDYIELSDLRIEKNADGSQMDVVLGWRALDRPGKDYTAFVHLIDQEQTIVAQHDQPPGGVANPTHLWAPNEVVRASFPLQLPPDVELEELTLRVGLYNPFTGVRLSILSLANDQVRAPDGTYLLVPLIAAP